MQERQCETEREGERERERDREREREGGREREGDVPDLTVAVACTLACWSSFVLSCVCTVADGRP